MFSRLRRDEPVHQHVDLVLPRGSMVTMGEFGPWLGAWAGTRRSALPGGDEGDEAAWDAPAQLPIGLAWSGPRAADTRRGEPEGGWVWTMSWARGSAGGPAYTGSPGDSGWEAAADLAQWLFDRARGAGDPREAGPGDYARAVVSGLARRTGGLVRVGGAGLAPPAPIEPTFSAYFARPVAVQEVLPVLGTVIPGVNVAAHPGGTSAEGASGWVIEAPDGRGAWLDVLDLADVADLSDLGGPGYAPFAALSALGAHLWAVRVEGAQDTIDAEGAAGLAACASAVARALGGLAVDPEGFPLG